MGAFYIEHEYWFAAIQLVLAMLGMGATLTGKDFRDVFLEPRSVSAGVAVQILLVPTVALLFVSIPGVDSGVAVGIALIAAIPGGTTSNIFTFLARGNRALSICITALTTLACLLTTPMILSALITDYMPADFAMPTGLIVREIGLTLLLPLALGMLYLYQFPRSASRFSLWCIRGSLAGIGLIVVGSISAGRLDAAAFGMGNIGLMLLFTTALWFVGRGAPMLLRRAPADITAIEIEVVVRNINLGVLIKASLFPAAQSSTAQLGDMVLFALLLYGALQLFAGGALIAVHKRRQRVAVKQ